ncbi:MAG TPA: SpoIIE family protein phosphatase [Jiangellaceae bacterium]
MSGTVSSFEHAYASALADYVRNRHESSLEQAHDLGRQALAVGLSVLDVTELHHRTIHSMTGGEPAEAKSQHESALPFLLQSLAALDMATRGFVEAGQRVAVEQAHVQRLHTLADQFAEMYVEQSIDKRLYSLAQDAAGLLEADGVRIRLGAQTATAGVAPPPTAVLPTDVPPSTRSAHGVWDLPTPIHWLATRLEPGVVDADADAGLIGVWRDRPFTAFDEALLAQFARLSATSVRNTLVYEHEHEAALTLQSSLLPAKLPSLDGISVQVRYRPSGARTGVGGDWFDVIELPNERVGLVIGDVMGHGLAAAAFMGQLRVALRAFATEGHSPSMVLERADRLLPTISGERIATVIYAIVEPDGRLRYANAGHPPPLLVQNDGSASYLSDGLSAPIGTGLPAGNRVESAVPLLPGARLLLYTDGLIERRDRHLDDGLTELRELLSKPALNVGELCDAALTLALETSPEDDICLLAVQLPS